MNSQDGLASLKALEQWLNLKARWLAGESTATGDEPPPASLVDKLSALRDVAKRAVDLAKSLPTGERWSIAGSAQKRIACLTTGKQQQSALTEMLSAYDEAVKCLDATKSGGIFYPRMQYCAASIATGTQSADFEKYLSEADAAITLANANDPNFWSHVAAVEIQVLKGVSLGNAIDATGLSQSLKTLQVAHRRTHEWNSVRVNLQFLMIVLPNGIRDMRKQAKLRDTLGFLIDVVAQFCQAGNNSGATN